MTTGFTLTEVISTEFDTVNRNITNGKDIINHHEITVVGDGIKQKFVKDFLARKSFFIYTLIFSAYSEQSALWHVTNQ